MERQTRIKMTCLFGLLTVTSLLLSGCVVAAGAAAGAGAGYIAGHEAGKDAANHHD